jgi:predicted DNA-binding transcriptional regulator AlpA
MSEATKREIEQRYNTGKKYFRAKEAAEYMCVGLSTVWHYASQGKLTPKKISARVTVFSIAEIDNLVNSVEVA